MFHIICTLKSLKAYGIFDVLYFVCFTLTIFKIFNLYICDNSFKIFLSFWVFHCCWSKWVKKNVPCYVSRVTNNRISIILHNIYIMLALYLYVIVFKFVSLYVSNVCIYRVQQCKKSIDINSSWIYIYIIFW